MTDLVTTDKINNEVPLLPERAWANEKSACNMRATDKNYLHANAPALAYQNSVQWLKWTMYEFIVAFKSFKICSSKPWVGSSNLSWDTMYMQTSSLA